MGRLLAHLDPVHMFSNKCCASFFLKQEISQTISEEMALFSATEILSDKRISLRSQMGPWQMPTTTFPC